MSTKRRIEIFSAGCAVCDETAAMVKRLACPSCDVTVLDMRDPTVVAKAKGYGVTRVPAIAVDGQLAACCTGRGPDEASLTAAGIGTPLS